MKIVVIGAGNVGLITGVCLAELEHSVVCVEKRSVELAQLQQGKTSIFEPDLNALLANNINANRIAFTNDLADAMQDCDVIFIAVGTPSRQSDGHADLTQIFETATEIAGNLTKNQVVVIKSTVPVGTNRKVAGIIQNLRPNLLFHSASNPEFLREGSAIKDFMHPERVVIGVETKHAEQVLRLVYRKLELAEIPIFATGLESAEVIKYAANAFLAMKITFINEIANLCEKTGADVQQVAHGIGLDRRIGHSFLQAGPGYGGSCLPKDTLALARTGRQVGAVQNIVETVITVNTARKSAMSDKIIAACGGSLAGKKITVFGVTFKPGTDDIRNAPSLEIIPKLLAAGASVTACDPMGAKLGSALLPEVSWDKDPYSAALGADAVLLITDWDTFHRLDLHRLKQAMHTPNFIDFRNIYKPSEMQRAGLDYIAIGKG